MYVKDPPDPPDQRHSRMVLFKNGMSSSRNNRPGCHRWLRTISPPLIWTLYHAVLGFPFSLLRSLRVASHQIISFGFSTSACRQSVITVSCAERQNEFQTIQSGLHSLPFLLALEHKCRMSNQHFVKHQMEFFFSK
jgi:hypothetical protein